MLQWAPAAPQLKPGAENTANRTVDLSSARAWGQRISITSPPSRPKISEHCYRRAQRKLFSHDLRCPILCCLHFRPAMSAENGFRQVHLCAPCARLNFRDVALGNSKAPCFSKDDGFMDFADCVPHHDGLEEVIECARAPDGCELCKSFVLKWVARGEGFRWPDDDDDGWYIDAKALVDREPRLRRCVLLMAPHYQYPFYETTSSAGVALWLIEEDKNLQMDMPLGFAKFSFRRGMFTPGLAAPGGCVNWE